MAQESDITHLLNQLAEGRAGAADALWPLVYDELRRLADHYSHDEHSDHALQPTALVHEAFLRLAGSNIANYQSRSQFFTVAARAMRRILIDHARRRQAAKRGGKHARVPLDTDVTPSIREDTQLLALDEALERLAQVDAQLAKLVELRFFAGLTFDETARILDVSLITAKRMWKMAKGWLHREIAKGE